MNTNEIIAKFMGYKPLFIEEAVSEMDYPRDTESITKETWYIKESVDIPFDVNHEDVALFYSHNYHDGHIDLHVDPFDLMEFRGEDLQIDCIDSSIYDDWKELMKVKQEINRRDLEIRACYGDQFHLNEEMERMNNCLIAVDLVGFKYFASRYIQLITKNK